MNSTNVPPNDRFCDLVMKGGITSGIVYPPLVNLLSKHYHFKSIGGTSAGAIAAVATAAAEYRRRQSGNADVFETLGKLPGELGKCAPGSSKSKLLSLFQPSPGCHRLFGVLISSLNAKGTWHRVGAIVWGLLSAYWIATLCAIIGGALVWQSFGAYHGLVAGGLLALILIVYWVYRDFTVNLPANDFGMCTGMSPPDADVEALTPWLHNLIQDLAGLPRDGDPLTFGDLWSAKGFPPSWITPPGDVKLRSIDLRMFTTNLSVGRPFVFPLTDETCRLFYLPSQLSPYLPTTVMNWMLTNSDNYAPKGAGDPPATKVKPDLKEFPTSAKLPILLAARMSLSFPILFSTIPLWAIDYDPPRDKRTVEPCTFSDGGISSNFPIHLFDGLLPMWPTFGVQLETKLPDRENMIYLPKNYWEGFGERWSRFADHGKKPVSRMGGFVGAIMATMQNWNDNTLSRMPGVRDRVVRVRLNPDEGGMNLNMPQPMITAVAKRGEDAAAELIKRFLPAPTDTVPAEGWDEQRWVRLNVLLAMLNKRFAGVQSALTTLQNHATGYKDLIAQGGTNVLAGQHAKLTLSQQKELLDSLDALLVLGQNLSLNVPPTQFHVIPEPDLRIRSSL